MPPQRQQRIEPTDDWRQLELLARAPGQHAYELIRPVVLFGQSPAERAAETGAAERTVYRAALAGGDLGAPVRDGVPVPAAAAPDLGRRRVAAGAPTVGVRALRTAGQGAPASALVLARRRRLWRGHTDGAHGRSIL